MKEISFNRIKIHRIYALLLRHFFVFRRNLDHLTGVFYWPAINLLLWGLASSYFESRLVQGSGIVFAIVSGIIFWIVVERGEVDVTFSLLQELWDRNLINLFVTPLTFLEWICSFIVITILKTFVSFLFALFLAFILYQANIFLYGVLIIPFGILFFMTGWWMGFFVAGLILRYGAKVQALAWTVPAVVAPFSAIYYPVSVLPGWAQYIANILPTSYVFENMRQIIATGTFDVNKLLISLGLNLFYLLCAIVFLQRSFSKVLTTRGLGKVY
ncbi:MAG: ABC transporter permease [Candidatus Sungbacteria bacterium]|nr:ABC transporter permease [Candidatus Sungbacteria bacterium]